MKRIMCSIVLMFSIFFYGMTFASTKIGVQFYVDTVLSNTWGENAMRENMERWVVEINNYYRESYW